MNIQILIMLSFLLQIISDESSSESSAVQNSATEISTDSEFAHDDPTPTRELPFIALNDVHVTKTRGSRGNYPKKIQVKTGYLQKPSKDKPSIKLKLEPIVPSAPFIKKPAPVLLPRTEGYTLNRTQSTGGIAAKVSLELKKKYLLGEATSGSIQKSGSASTLDTKFKSFQTTITDCQKLLKPAPEVSASMQTFCNKLNERKSPVLSPQSSIVFGKCIETNDKNRENHFNPIVVPDIIENKEILPSNESNTKTDVFENESEGRPRSPAYETSIIVPQIDWNKGNESLSSDSLATSDSDNEMLAKQFQNIPRVEIHQAHDDIAGEMALDSLCVVDNELIKQSNESIPTEGIVSKSITTEKKTLNQPKALPNLENILPEIHNSLHVKCESLENEKIEDENDDMENKPYKNSSGISTPESVIEQPTAAFTETELSDWARDEVVSDDFDDVYESNNVLNKKVQIAEIRELEDSQINKQQDSNAIGDNKKDTINLDNIEFMDTGTETSSEDGNIDSQEGYVLLKNDDELNEDSLNYAINETKNVHIFNKEPKNTGYCFISTDDNIKTPVVTLKSTNENLKQNNDHEDDSLQVIETGTTTEENTFSDSTVKNITEIIADKQTTQEKDVIDNNYMEQPQMDEDLLNLKTPVNEQINLEQSKFSPKEDILEFDEHCQRLQSRVEFSNARDSIDVRKSRRRSKSDLPQKPDLIQEEKIDNAKEIMLNLSPTPHTPDILYNKDIIKKERDVNQKLIQEMVMNKMKAENKSLERKKRNRLSTCSLSPNPLSKSATTDISSRITPDSFNNRQSTYSTGSSTYSTPDVLLTSNHLSSQNNTPSIQTVNSKNYESPFGKATEGSISKLNDSFVQTPVAPPRYNRQNDDIHRKLSKLERSILSKQNNAKKNNHQTDGNPNVTITDKKNSCLYSNDTLKKKNNNSFRRSASEDSQRAAQKLSLPLDKQQYNTPMRTKSIPDVKSEVLNKKTDYDATKEKMCKSDPNMLEIADSKPKKKSKDRERRKSITKLFTTLFTKKSPNSNGSKGLFSKLSPKSKEISKVGFNTVHS